MPDDAPSMRLAGSPPNGPALAIKATGDSWSASELVYQARALKQVYQRTWRLEDVEAQIHLYHRALELICGCNGLERLSFGGNSRQTIRTWHSASVRERMSHDRSGIQTFFPSTSDLLPRLMLHGTSIFFLASKRLWWSSRTIRG